jgi:hypothetical protein
VVPSLAHVLLLNAPDSSPPKRMSWRLAPSQAACHAVLTMPGELAGCSWVQVVLFQLQLSPKRSPLKQDGAPMGRGGCERLV